MLQITYVSTARPELPATAIADILRVSRRNNAVAGVTGLLLYDGYRFLQALEGEAGRVNQIYAGIKADPRHRAVVTLGARETATRAFGDWAMASQRVAIVTGSTVLELVDRLTEEVADTVMRDLFRTFARVRIAA